MQITKHQSLVLKIGNEKERPNHGAFLVCFVLDELTIFQGKQTELGKSSFFNSQSSNEVKISGWNHESDADRALYIGGAVPLIPESTGPF